MQTATSTVLYNAQGQVYCTAAPNFNCQDFYQVDEVLENFSCGSADDGQRIIPAQTVTTAYPTSTTDFTLFPNPSKGQFFVKLVTDSDAERTLTILNTQGQILQQQTVTPLIGEQTIELNLGNQAAGMYFIQVSSKEGNKVQRLILK